MSNETALITGGCGCMGYHIVKAVLSDTVFKSVHVFSRNPTQNQLPGVQYHAGNLTSEEDIRSILDIIKPTIIFHVASPVSFGTSANLSLFYEVNVQGTQTLLDYATKASYVKAFVYTSSTTVSKPPYRFNDETQPLVDLDSKADFNYYTVTKAIADIATLKANDPTGKRGGRGEKGLRTCSLRIGPIYGTHDNQMLPGLLSILQEGREHSQIGNNKALMDFVSVGNSARAHVLAGKALLQEFENGDATDENPTKVSGEAFFITDGNPVHFWDFGHKVWEAAGTVVKAKDIRVFPAWFIIGLAVTAEWVYWVFTFGNKTPKRLRSHIMRYITEDRTFSIEKARVRLLYDPVDDRDETIKEGVAWALSESPGLADLKKH